MEMAAALGLALLPLVVFLVKKTTEAEHQHFQLLVCFSVLFLYASLHQILTLCIAYITLQPHEEESYVHIKRERQRESRLRL